MAVENHTLPAGVIAGYALNVTVYVPLTGPVTLLTVIPPALNPKPPTVIPEAIVPVTALTVNV